jgi:hypothetical protein
MTSLEPKGIYMLEVKIWKIVYEFASGGIRPLLQQVRYIQYTISSLYNLLADIYALNQQIKIHPFFPHPPLAE